LTSALVSFQIASRPFTEWFNVVAMQKSGDTSCRHLEGSKMTATSQEYRNTASGTGVSIITSSMKAHLALQHWLINTSFFLSMFCDARAENSQKSPPDWGRLDATFSSDIVTRHVYCPCVEFDAFFLRNYSMKCQICCLIIILTSSILILRSTPRHLTRWRSRSCLKKLLVRWDLIFRDCQLEIQRYVHASKLKPQTQRTCVSDQVSISNEAPPCRGRRPIRPRGLQIALYPALRLLQTARFHWHQTGGRHDRYHSIQLNQGHGGYNTKYVRHVLESRHSNTLRFLQEVRLTKSALYWKWSQFHSHCQVLPTPSWKELLDKLKIQHQLHGSLRVQDLSDVANHLYCMMDTELSVETTSSHNTRSTDYSESRLTYDLINSADGMRIALMMLLGCVDATLTRPWSQQVGLLGGGDDVMDEDETPSGKRDTSQAPTDTEEPRSPRKSLPWERGSCGTMLPYPTDPNGWVANIPAHGQN